MIIMYSFVRQYQHEDGHASYLEGFGACRQHDSFCVFFCHSFGLPMPTDVN